IAKHERLIADAAKKKVQILGLQELFYGPYFCAEQQTRWYELTERIPDGPTISLMQKLAKKYQMVLIVPVYEVEMTGVYFNTAAGTVAGRSEYLWELEQPAHAVTNAYFVASINRVGTEAPWKIGEFYGKSYFCDPRGKIVAQASRDKDELLVAELNLDEIQKVRDTWQFYRDRRPESYGEIVRTQAATSAAAS